MSLYQIIMLIILILFYLTYFIKMILMRKKGILADVLGRGKKSKKAFIIEILLKAVTFAGAAVQFISVIFIWSGSDYFIQLIGSIIACSGLICFILSVTTMKDNWRAGFTEDQDTSLVTTGIYSWSRNPAFLGFDLIYIGCVLAFFNIFNIIITACALILFHLQILMEEGYLTGAFGEEYIEYKKKTRRYFGSR